MTSTLDTMTLDHLSPSSIATYLDSPLRWRQHYVAGERDRYSLSLHRGLVAHDVLEALANGADPEKWIDDHVDIAWDARQSDDNRMPDDDVPALKSLLKSYWANHGQHLDVHHVEWPFALELPYARKFKTLIGRIDLVYKLGDGFGLIDYKTGARKRSMNDVKNDPQAIIYGMAARDLLGIKGIVPFAYHQLIFKTFPEVAILERPVSPAEMEQFEERFLPGFVKTLEWQIENDAWYYSPNAKFGTGLNAA